METTDKCGCPSDDNCTSFRWGKGAKKCLDCWKIENLVEKHNSMHSKGLLLDSEQMDSIKDNRQVTDIFVCLSKIEPRDRAIFEDYEFGSVSMNNIAKQRGLSRQQVYNIVEDVRIKIKKQMNLSTVI